MKNLSTKLLIIFSGLGMLVTSYLIFQHYKPVGTSICNINDYINCDIVNKSEYSEIFGVPVSIFGFLAYGVFFVFGIALLSGKKWAKNNQKTALGFSIAGLLFSLYLTYVEFFILFTACLFCIAQQVFIFIITLLLASIIWRSKKSSQ